MVFFNIVCRNRVARSGSFKQAGISDTKARYDVAYFREYHDHYWTTTVFTRQLNHLRFIVSGDRLNQGITRQEEIK